MPHIELRNIKKSFSSTKILTNLSFTIKKESFTVLLGPSGCGKSTILRIIAGLEEPTSGLLLINGKDMTKKEPSKRGLSMVFQSYALFPHLNIKENILFGLKVRKVSKEEQEKRLKKVIKLVGLEELLHRKPSELSGGQKQRVALARAFVAKNKICLMDEPLSNLDAKLRHEMRIEIKKLQEKLKMTVLYVTHDQTEAMSMADKIILLNKGEIEQEGTPKELYEKVKTTFVAKFIGSPPMNVLSLKDCELNLDKNYSNRITKNNILFGIRPEDLYISSKEKGLKAKILFQDYQGSDTILSLKVNKENSTFYIKIKGHGLYENGDRIWVNWDEEKAHTFDSKAERREI